MDRAVAIADSVSAAAAAIACARAGIVDKIVAVGLEADLASEFELRSRASGYRFVAVADDVEATSHPHLTAGHDTVIYLFPSTNAWQHENHCNTLLISADRRPGPSVTLEPLAGSIARGASELNVFAATCTNGHVNIRHRRPIPLDPQDRLETVADSMATFTADALSSLATSSSTADQRISGERVVAVAIDRRINWLSTPATDVVRTVKACSFPGAEAYTSVRGIDVYIGDAAVVDVELTLAAPGRVLAVNETSLLVSTSDGLAVQLSGLRDRLGPIDSNRFTAGASVDDAVSELHELRRRIADLENLVHVLIADHDFLATKYQT